MSQTFQPPPITTSYDEYECTDSDISVVGRLRQNVSFWKSIGASRYISDIVRIGYLIPFTTQPPGVYLRNNATSRNNAQFVRETIDSLVWSGAVQEVEEKPYIVNPLTVSQKNDKMRLVLDLRHVNKYVQKQACKIEGFETLHKFLPGSKFMFGFDLKAGYHHVDIRPKQHSLLGFAFHDHRGRERYFIFRVMPFGLSSAGFVFTKLLRVLIKHWRRQSLKVLAFFDDGLGTTATFEEGLIHSQMVKTDLLNAGYVPNKTKCSWLPRNVMTWLGFIYDLVRGLILATSDKILKTTSAIYEILLATYVPVTQLASVIGLITSMFPAFGDVVLFKSKFSQMIVAMDDDWERKVSLSQKSRNEMKFWSNYLPNNNGMMINCPVANAVLSFSDASATGCATIITTCPDRQKIVVHRQFSEEETHTSSTYRELLGVYHGLQQAKFILANKAVRWFTDASNVVNIIRKGSMIPDLLQLAINIFEITKQHNIYLTMT